MASRAIEIADDARAEAGEAAWFTCAELAALGLPGLPRNKRALNRRIGDEGWAYRRDSAGMALARPRTGRGGGMEFHVHALPPAAQVELVRRGVTAPAPAAPAEHVRAGTWRWYDRQSSKVKAEAARRIAVIEQIELFVASGMNRSAAVGLVKREHAISSATLWNWLGEVKGVVRADWAPALAPRWEGGGADAQVDSHIWTMLLSDYLRPECPTFSSCYDRAADVAEAEGRPIPSARTMKRKLDRELSTYLVTFKRKGEEALRRSVPAQRRTVDHLHALQIVNIDGHQIDISVVNPIDPTGKPVRPVLVAIQDVYSSKILAWCADISENSIQTQIAFGNLFRDWGIPGAVLLDNGRAFASKQITGGQATRYRFKIMPNEPTGVLTALDINAMWAKPYRGQSKPIERAWRDMADRISRHPAAAGAYLGNSVANKPHNYGERSMPWDEFIDHVTKGIARHNAQKGRRGRHYAGRSFDEVFAESYATAPITKATPEHLRLALLTAQWKRIKQQTSEIELFGNRYWDTVLGEHRGKRVLVRFDPENLHSSIFIYTEDGKFLTEATNIANNGFETRSGARDSEKRWKDVRKTQRAADDALALFDAGQVAARQPDPVVPAAPDASVVRMRRHRGQTAAALKIDEEQLAVPLPSAGSKIINLFGRVRPDE